MAIRLIIGVGQSLRRDDAAGLAAIKRWQEHFPEHAGDSDLIVACVELPGIALLDHLANAEQGLIVDAVSSGAHPGRLHRLAEQDVADFVQGSVSAHGWGVAETLALGRRLQPERMPAQVDILGIEVMDVSLGEGLSLDVGAAIDFAASEIEAWLKNPGEWGRK